jgi:hypothetical protein
MRLYRGLKTRYRPDQVGGTAPYFGTDFTDCPHTALRYAAGRRGEVLVLDIGPATSLRISEEVWLGQQAKRLMVWGRFDELLAGVFPATLLRAQVHRKGIASASDEYKARVLERFINESLQEEGGSGQPRSALRSPTVHRKRDSPRGHFSTSTVTSDGRLVPWLAASGPLAYTPENPPDRDYYFQYGWVMPGILAESTNRRQHYFFGASHKDHAKDVFSFWKTARQQTTSGLALCFGSVTADAVTAPVAIYSAPEPRGRGPACVFMQHGSYQIVDAADQPLLESGEVVLYRGLGKAETFRLMQADDLNAQDRDIWLRYVRAQADMLSDSVRSFNSIHDRAKRCETGHIRDGTWMSDDIARQYGMDVDSDGFARDLWNATHQSFSLARWVAERKFGPHYVVCKTPLDNIRLTTFFAGEHEVRILSPRRVVLLDSHGCRVDGGASGSAP